MSGKTSLVTHFLNFLADSNLDENTRLYKPDSFIRIGFCSLPMESRIVTPSIFSSESTWSINAFLVFEYPNTFATSLPTK